MKEFAESFYKGKAWQKCSRDYKKSVGGLCERCKTQGLAVAGVIVHHKERVTPLTINDPSITYNWENLELLCKTCHNKEHKAEIFKNNTEKRYKINELGELIIENSFG